MKRVLFTLFICLLFLGKSFAQPAIANFVFNVACKGDSTTLVSTSTTTLPDTITLYSWDLDGDLVFGDAYGPVVHFYWPNTGNYDVGLKIWTQLGLMESVYHQVPISQITADFTAEDFCLGDVTKFYDQSIPINCTIDKYEWSFGTTYLSNLQNPTYNYLTVGSYNVSLTVFTENGCQDTKSTIINIYDVPVFTMNFSRDSVKQINGVPYFEMFRGQSLIASVNIQNAYTDIIWSNNSHNDSITIFETGFYTVEVLNADGCSTSYSFYVTVKEDLNINPMPVITPNEDGINDAFLIKEYMMPDDMFTLKVYNRYGDEVYSSSNYKNDWKGTYEGKTLPDGSYYYYLVNKRDDKVYKGAVNILTDN